ncbi:unnamed protein product, partial [Mesorhabditis belari]|uniref:C-type lectin domain-containing protein n=1 Tax=Mesorhabditis belari TaxID=2138241 RepID=A0AAF3F2A1_9BILA
MSSRTSLIERFMGLRQSIPIHNVNYEMANDLCKSMSSHLVTVENEEKNALVLELTKSGILSESFSTQTLLGAKKRKSLKLTWSHGLINNFTKWVDEKMIEENDERKCVAMITDNAEKWIDSLWMTVPCETMQRISLNECVHPQKSTIVQTPISIKTGCPEGWFHSRHFKSCYKSVYNVNFDEATAICRSVNGELVTVNNDLKNLLVLELTKADKMIDLFYGNVIIGAKKGDNETLIWSNGKPNAYKRWSPREPNGGNVERCVNMYTDETIGYKGDLSGISRWNDFPCDQRQRVALCEMNILK